ncbi:MAG: hypothetical protein GY708_04595 [Actinomycetia bacterium]|nr:hypothetical protein [Actinomycetes bacterium]MCP4963025.1 hypothetical protein [Actinomycetes bacterium]
MNNHLQADLDGVADQLETIGETLAEMGIGVLRDAIDDPDSDGKRPAEEKRITRARRSVEKAAALLRNESSAGVL